MRSRRTHETPPLSTSGIGEEILRPLQSLGLPGFVRRHLPVEPFADLLVDRDRQPLGHAWHRIVQVPDTCSRATWSRHYRLPGCQTKGQSRHLRYDSEADAIFLQLRRADGGEAGGRRLDDTRIAHLDHSGRVFAYEFPPVSQGVFLDGIGNDDAALIRETGRPAGASQQPIDPPHLEPPRRQTPTPAGDP